MAPAVTAGDNTVADPTDNSGGPLVMVTRMLVPSLVPRPGTAGVPRVLRFLSQPLRS